MLALGWDEETRTLHRRNWYRGELNARDWLHIYIPSPELWINWDETTQTALKYLDNRLHTMDYALFTKQGLSLGSAQVEAMNKAVIGHRMKRSGMHCSSLGAAGLASLRAQIFPKHSLIDFNKLRFHAFSLAA